MNSMPYLMSSIESFKQQKYKNKELIIVYSKSNDHTDIYLDSINEKNIRKFNFNGSIYKALNFGIKMSKGEIVGILHSDDIFFSSSILNTVAEEFKKNKLDIVFGNILYSNKNNLLNIERSWNKIIIKNKYDIPPHTGTFINKKIYKKFKYNENYYISSDTDFLIRVFSNNIKYKYINNYISIMRMGGISSNLFSIFKKIKEDISIYKIHRLTIFDYLRKVISKTSQFIILDKTRRSKYHSYLNNISKVNFIDLKNIKNINGKVISALNLAFITYNFKFKLRTHNYLFWPDGIFTTYFTNIKKIPGRVFFKNFISKVNNEKKIFKKVYVLGNLPLISKNWLKKKINYSFLHIDLPYGDIKKINLKLNKINFLKNSIIILTLPTPKQELIANLILSKSPKVNIICIGGSINILSGYEKKTPSILYKLNLEWLWRLKFDSRRRIIRLLESGILLIKLKFFGKSNIF